MADKSLPPPDHRYWLDLDDEWDGVWDDDDDGIDLCPECDGDGVVKDHVTGELFECDVCCGRGEYP